jgi:hypothetical protein
MLKQKTAVFWVSPDIDTWRLQREGAHRPEKIFQNREEAIDWACRLAVENAPCLVKVQDYSGNVTTQLDFARAPAHAAE